MDKKGLFIAFEGIDGSGKSTQVKKLAEWLTERGHKVYATFEPTDSYIGKSIRGIFSHQIEGDQKVIAALFVADRLHHLLNSENGLLKKIEEGYIVITDRYYLSSYAYHSIHGIDLEWIIQANSMSADLLKPDLNLFIDVDPIITIKRLLEGRQNIEMYETLDNLKKVQNQYYHVINKVENQENIQIVNGNNTVDNIFNTIVEIIRPLIA